VSTPGDDIEGTNGNDIDIADILIVGISDVDNFVNSLEDAWNTTAFLKSQSSSILVESTYKTLAVAESVGTGLTITIVPLSVTALSR